MFPLQLVLRSKPVLFHKRIQCHPHPASLASLPILPQLGFSCRLPSYVSANLRQWTVHHLGSRRRRCRHSSALALLQCIVHSVQTHHRLKACCTRPHLASSRPTSLAGSCSASPSAAGGSVSGRGVPMKERATLRRQHFCPDQQPPALLSSRRHFISWWERAAAADSLRATHSGTAPTAPTWPPCRLTLV